MVDFFQEQTDTNVVVPRHKSSVRKTRPKEKSKMPSATRTKKVFRTSDTLRAAR